MAFCENCGQPLSEGAKFCANCGSAAGSKVVQLKKEKLEEIKLNEYKVTDEVQSEDAPKAEEQKVEAPVNDASAGYTTINTNSYTIENQNTQSSEPVQLNKTESPSSSGWSASTESSGSSGWAEQLENKERSESKAKSEKQEKPKKKSHTFTIVCLLLIVALGAVAYFNNRYRLLAVLAMFAVAGVWVLVKLKWLILVFAAIGLIIYGWNTGFIQEKILGNAKVQQVTEKVQNTIGLDKDDDKDKTEVTTNTAPVPDGVDPELKAYLDSYEAFIDEYVSFMTKYSSDSGNALTMLMDYNRMLEKMAEFDEKLDEYDEEDMSEADWNYYLEVMNRCNSKMISAAVSID